MEKAMNRQHRVGCLVVVAGFIVLGAAFAAEAQKAAPVGPTVRADEIRIMDVLKDLDTKRSGMMNVPIEDARLLRIMALATNAKHVVEIGTSNGYSGLWLCLALQSTGGKLTTFELDAGRAALARKNFKRAGVDSIVILVEGDAHKELARLKGPIDLAFIDAEKPGYYDYLNQLLPLVRPNGVILAHNTANLGSQMKDYIDAVTKNPDLETIFLNTDNQGMAVTVKKPAPPKPAAEKPTGPVLGYINTIPPESDEQRAARRKKIAEHRQGTPVLVHRGDWSSAPENTLEAYAAAMDRGADGVEIDIRRSKDGVLYLHHDDNAGRVISGEGKVRDLTYYEILSRGMTKVFGTANKDTRAPTLAAFLALARQRCMLLHLDVKEPGLQDEIIAMFDEADVWDHVVEVNAGNAERIRSHPKVKLLPYKGWWPAGKDAENPEMARITLAKPGVMIICEEPGAAVKMLKKPVPPAPVPLPNSLRVLWKPEGPIPQL
jgi:caffeoyl-CoA O-methyltransferase